MTSSLNDYPTTRPSDHATKYIFFSGKGGVGKTSMACTHAVRYADEGKRTLIVTTDPASNLADMFEQAIGHHVTPIAGVPNLSAMEIDPDQVTQEYIDRAMAPIRAAFPAQMVQVMEEQMSGPCTAEVAAFDRFTDFLDLPAQNGDAYDVVIFDTAPTGHTLRRWNCQPNGANQSTRPARGAARPALGQPPFRMPSTNTSAPWRPCGTPRFRPLSLFYTPKRLPSVKRAAPSANWKNWTSRISS